MIRDSGAGVHGWVDAEISDWHVNSLKTDSDDLLRSGTDLPPAAEDDRHGERKSLKKSKDPTESNGGCGGAIGGWSSRRKSSLNAGALLPAPPPDPCHAPFPPPLNPLGGEVPAARRAAMTLSRSGHSDLRCPGCLQNAQSPSKQPLP